MTVKTAKATSTGTLVSGSARLLGLHYVASGSAGTITLKDGGSGGTARLALDTPAAVGSQFVPVAGGGLRFATDVHATLSNVTSVTAVYDDAG